MGLIVSIIILAALVIGAFQLWNRLSGGQDLERQRWFRTSVNKGVVVPILIWIFLNSGLLLPPMLPQIEIAKPGWPRFSVLLNVISIGVLVIGSCWAAVTCGWLLATIARRVENYREFAVMSLIWSAILFPLAWALVYFEGWGYVGFAAVLWFGPLAHLTLPLVMKIRLPPSYSAAVAKMQFGKYEEAESEVIRELEKCEDDFDGWMMLAGIYANHFHDLAGAERTVRETCQQPNANASQINGALLQLADWHLKLGQDPVAARRVLEEICRRFPGTHLDRMARLRINGLASSKDELAEQQKIKPLRLPALNHDLDNLADVPVPEINRSEAASQANQFVERLKQNPNDIAAREELARIFAERLDKADRGLEQLELLLAMPDQPAKKAAEWLSLMAAWQLRYQHDELAARTILTRLIREYPKTPQAFAAQGRLGLMDIELKLRKNRPAGIASVKLPG